MTVELQSAIAEVLRETPLHATDAARKLGVTAQAVVRWIRRGRSAGGRKVRLAGFKAGRGWQTSEEALARFLAACSPAIVDPPEQCENRRVTAARARFAKVLKRLGRPRAEVGGRVDSPADPRAV